MHYSMAMPFTYQRLCPIYLAVSSLEIIKQCWGTVPIAFKKPSWLISLSGSVSPVDSRRHTMLASQATKMKHRVAWLCLASFPAYPGDKSWLSFSWHKNKTRSCKLTLLLLINLGFLIRFGLCFAFLPCWDLTNLHILHLTFPLR